jgi:PAS domain S-box-containing protein
MTESSFRLLLLRFALVPVLTLFIFLAALDAMIHQITASRAQASQATSILLASNSLLRSMIDEETGIRGYLIARDASFLQPYHNASSQLGGELSALSALVSADPSLPGKVAEVTRSFRDFDTINRALLTENLPHDTEVGLLTKQMQAMDTLRAELADLISEQNRSRETGRREMDQLYGMLPAIGIGGGTLVAILLIWHGVSVFRQITRAFQQQLNESEIRRDSLETTLESIGDAVIVCDNAGNITLFNSTAQEVTGWTKAKAIGQPLNNVFRIISEHSRQPVESPVSKVLREGNVVGLANHTLFIRPDQSEIAIDDSGAPIRDRNNAIVGVVLVFRDIEARRKAERDLELRTAELESMLSNSPAGFASFDRAHRYMRVNQTLADIDGVAAEGHLGKTVREVFPTHAATIEPIIDFVFKERTSVQREFVGQFATNPGVERQWLICFYPVVTEHQDDPVSVGAIVLETTDQWRARESLLRSEKLAAVGRLAASIAHEMNNPLTSVTNLLYLINMDQSIQSATRELVDRANIELARVSKIAMQTLRFAKRSTSPAPVDLEELVSGVLLLFSGRIALNHITVVKRVRAAHPYIGHANELMQALTNLVSNALDAVGSRGKIIVSIQTSKNRKTNQDGIAITVADSGSGIPEASRVKIWEPFFTTKQDTGTGLGLWLVDEMVRNNGGAIHLRSSTEPMRSGTTFRVFLPNRGE